MSFKDIVLGCQSRENCDLDFEKLHSRFVFFIESIAKKWMLNRNIAANYQFDDLVQVFNAKLYGLIPVFRIKHHAGDEENERIFAGMLKRSLRNIAIDLEYRATRPIRYPVGGIVSLLRKNDKGEEVLIDVPMTVKNDERGYYDLIRSVAEKLHGDALQVFECKARGHKDTAVAVAIGMKAHRVKSLIDGPIARAMENVLGPV